MQFAVIDAETDPFARGNIDIRPFAWGFYDGCIYRQFVNSVCDGKEQFDCTQKLMDFLLSVDEETIIYAHNGGKFDFHYLLDWLEADTEIMIINGRLAKFTIGKCEFRDSYLLLPVPLAAYEKQKIDYAFFTRELRQSRMRDILDYLKSDCVYLYRLIESFNLKYGVSLTMAGASLKKWAAMYDRKPPSSNRDYYARLQPYYYGGRVECFKQGVIEHDYQVYDINSAYPFAMLQRHPIETRFIEFPLTRRIYSSYVKRAYLGNCFFTLEGVSKGAFPYRDEQGKTSYPTDSKKRLYHITGWELKAAVDTDSFTLSKPVSVIEYPLEGCKDFSDYILHFYAERKEAKKAGDKANTLFTKLFMNSLYGKFGANPDNYDKFMLIDAENEPQYYRADKADWQFCSEVNDELSIVYKNLPENEQHYYNVATSASITGYVRAYLWRVLKQCDTPLYCDTDSIAAFSFPDSLPIGGELGEWDIIDGFPDHFDYAAIAGKKLYAMRGKNGEWKTASKGAKLSADEIIRVAQGEAIRYTQESITFHFGKASQITRTITRTV